MKEYVENMKAYMKNMKKYVANMKKYEEICRYIGFSTPIHTYMGLRTWRNSEHRLHVCSLWDLEKFRILSLYVGLGTWKNSTRELPPGLWDF